MRVERYPADQLLFLLYYTFFFFIKLLLLFVLQERYDNLDLECEESVAVSIGRFRLVCGCTVSSALL